MKKVIFSLLILSMFFSTIGCSSVGAESALKAGDTVVRPEAKDIKNNIDRSDENKSDMELVGSTSGNLNNFGYYAYEDGWVYYGLDQLRNGKGLYKKRMDDKKPIKLSDHFTRSINVVGDWIYYMSAEQGVYKIKIDGTKEELICKDENIINMYVYGDWIICHSDKVYRMKTDGSEKVILSDKKVFKIIPDKNKVYFIVLDTYKIPSKELYEIDCEKENPIGEKILDIDMKNFDIPTLHPIIQDGWIYYIDYAIEEGRIAKIKVDGTEKTILTDKPAVNLNIKDGWIYYLEAKEQPKFTDKAYIKIGDKKIKRNVVPYMDLKYKLHKITVEGNNKTLLVDKELDFWKKIYLIHDQLFLMKLGNDEIISVKRD